MNMVLGAVGAKGETSIDRFVDFFDKFDPVTTAFLATLNLILVFIVFRFTRKMSQSKLSVSTELAKGVAMTPDGKIYPRFDLYHDKKYFKEIQLEEEGFPIVNQSNRDPWTTETLFLRVKNRGDLPSTNIKIQLSLKIYKTEIKYNKDDPEDLDILSQKRKKHQTILYNINIPYMGADEERLYDLFELYGQLRETELILLKIKANGHVYFKENIISYLFRPTIINYYRNTGLDYLSDSHDARMFFGHRKMWKAIKEEEKKREEEQRRAQEERRQLLEEESTDNNE